MSTVFAIVICGSLGLLIAYEISCIVKSIKNKNKKNIDSDDSVVK